MRVSRTPRHGVAGLLLVVTCLSLAACSASAPSVATPAPSVAPTGPPTVAPTHDPTPTETPSAAASQVATTPSPTAASAIPSPTATPGPTLPPTPSPGSTPTASPTSKPTVKPTARPTAKPTPRATVGPVVLGIEARDFAFSPSSATGPADVSFVIRFANSDAAIPHNVTVSTDAGALRFNGTIINGVASTTYQVPALAAGTYRLGCIVHPAMTGTLTID